MLMRAKKYCQHCTNVTEIKRPGRHAWQLTFWIVLLSNFALVAIVKVFDSIK